MWYLHCGDGQKLYMGRKAHTRNPRSGRPLIRTRRVGVLTISMRVMRKVRYRFTRFLHQPPTSYTNTCPKQCREKKLFGQERWEGKKNKTTNVINHKKFDIKCIVLRFMQHKQSCGQGH